jgi:hypothetical protein
MAASAPNCGVCKECLDMPAFGGPGLRRQRCVHRGKSACRQRVSSGTVSGSCSPCLPCLQVPIVSGLWFGPTGSCLLFPVCPVSKFLSSLVSGLVRPVPVSCSLSALSPSSYRHWSLAWGSCLLFPVCPVLRLIDIYPVWRTFEATAEARCASGKGGQRHGPWLDQDRNCGD